MWSLSRHTSSGDYRWRISCCGIFCGPLEGGEALSLIHIWVAVAVNKANFTHDMIQNAGVFNLSVLSTSVPFEVFRHFGFQSGRDTEKFTGDVPQERSENGLVYLPQYTNAFISARVIEQQDCGTHTPVSYTHLTRRSSMSRWAPKCRPR